MYQCQAEEFRELTREVGLRGVRDIRRFFRCDEKRAKRWLRGEEDVPVAHSVALKAMVAADQTAFDYGFEPEE